MNNIRFLYITDMLIPADETPAILMRWRGVNLHKRTGEERRQ